MNNRRNNRGGDLGTNLQLYAATKEQQYRDRFLEQIWGALDRNVNNTMQTALDAVPYMDADYKEKLRPYVEKYAQYIKSFDTQNPYGVPIGLGNWAGVNAVLNFGITVNYAHIYFPDIVAKDEVYRVSNWLYGCHPYHNYSFVAVVGATGPSRCSMATTAPTSPPSRVMWHRVCCSVSPTTSRTTTTGPSSGARTRVPSPATHSISFSAQR